MCFGLRGEPFEREPASKTLDSFTSKQPMFLDEEREC